MEADERERILNIRLNGVKKQSLGKRLPFTLTCDLDYDLSERKRSKCAYTIGSQRQRAERTRAAAPPVQSLEPVASSSAAAVLQAAVDPPNDNTCLETMVSFTDEVDFQGQSLHTRSILTETFTQVCSWWGYSTWEKNMNLSSDEKLLMYSKLKLISHLHDFLKSIDDGSQRLPRQFRNLITSLASQSSVCGYIHPTDAVSSLMKDLVSGLEIKKDPQIWHQLHTHIPILFEVLEGDNNPSAPLEIRPLLNDLWLSSLSPFALCEKTMETSELCDEDEMSFFPSLPVCRSRGVYHKDRLKSDKSCSKTYKGHPSLLPGVFTIYCPHGICHGFQVMQTNESPNIPFTVLRTRFKTAPKVVIYDNACALHAYCMNRDPEFFKNTIFLVDRLHWDNHSGCSVGFCLALYPSLACLNSQVNEQGNAGLKRIKDQLSYMTAEHFMEHSSLYLWNKYRLKKNKL